MDALAYLRRIGIESKRAPDIAFLTEMQNRHLLSIPFENLDIVPLRKRFTLSAEESFKKIVLGHRGGFCYENNSLLGEVLRELGFDVTYLSAGVRRDDGSFGPDFDHMALLVKLDEFYIVDGGFGDSSRNPLPLGGDVRTDVSGMYRIRREIDDFYYLERSEDGGWKPQYRFTLIPRALGEYDPMCLYHQTSPLSSFTSKSVCSLAAENGRRTLSGMTFAVTEGNARTERLLADDEEWRAVLKTYFEIQL